MLIVVKRMWLFLTTIVLVVQQHWHNKHQDVLLVGLCRRNNHASATWIGKLNCNLVAREAVQNLVDGASLETNVHSGSCIVARDTLLGACGKVDVLGCKTQQSLFDVETNKLAALASKWQHALKGAHKRLAVDGKAVGVVVWDNRVVVGVATLY